jgi:hypothetical protein
MKMYDVLKHNLLVKLIGLFSLPAIGLFWLGYRLQGIPCAYKPELVDVVPLVPVTKNQYFLMRVIPFILLLVMAGLVLGLVYLAGISVN